MMEKNVYSVSQLNHLARLTLEEVFSTVLVEGEISNFVVPRSGHWYLTLKDEHAQVRCAMFKSRNMQVDFELEDGMHVLAKGRVSLYEGRGDFQLIIDKLEEIGDGKLRRAFEQLKQKLDKQGLFDTAHKKPLPDFIQTVGVVTSATGAAVRDILSVIRRRFPAMHVIIYPTLVQGKTAASHIVDAIEIANKRAECDALIVTRGGGSLEDLWPFNEEIVAQAIFKSQLPIISAVGHEIDFTIADFVADVRAPTPSAAAELVTPDQIELQNTVKQLYERLTRTVFHHLEQQKKALTWLTRHLQQQHPKQQLQQQSQHVDYLEQRLKQAIKTHCQTAKQALAEYAKTLHALSPLNTLSRGYAIVSQNDRIIKTIKAVKPGDKVETKLQDGTLACTVDERHPAT